jgi:hypothetical protein
MFLNPPFFVSMATAAKFNTTSTTSRAGTTYHHKSNTNSATSRIGTTYHDRNNAILSLVEQKLLTITRVI